MARCFAEGGDMIMSIQCVGEREREREREREGGGGRELTWEYLYFDYGVTASTLHGPPQGDHYHTLSCRRPATEDRENKKHDQEESVKEHFIFQVYCLHTFQGYHSSCCWASLLSDGCYTDYTPAASEQD